MEERRRTVAVPRPGVPEGADPAGEVDRLTGLLAREAFRAVLDREAAFAAGQGGALSLALLALEGLEIVRRDWGARGAEAALAVVARRLRQATRSGDPMALWAPGTVALLLRDVNDGTARLVAERLRRMAGNAAVEWEGMSFRPRLSAGVAALDPDTPTGEALATAAEGHLVRALAAGGDRVHPGL